MHKKIDPLANDVIRGAALITDTKNVFCLENLLFVRAYSPLFGVYQDTYVVGLREIPNKQDVLFCLNQGSKLFDIRDLLNRFK